MSSTANVSVEFLTTTRLGEKGQFTIPKEYRDELQMEAGAPVAVLRIGNGLMLIPEQARFRQLCDGIANAFTGHGISSDDLLESLPAARERVFDRHYPLLTTPARAGSKKRRP